MSVEDSRSTRAVDLKGVREFGFRFKGVWFGVWGLGFRVQG